MRLFFLSKHWKFIVDSKYAKKMPNEIYRFSDSLIYVGNGKFSLLIREYSQLGVNVLSSSPKIPDPIENNFFELNLAQKYDKLGQKSFRGDPTSFGVSLTGSLRNGSRNKPCYAFKQAHLSQCKTSEILERLGSLFFLKTLEIYYKFQKCKKNVAKNFWFFRQFELCW